MISKNIDESKTPLYQPIFQYHRAWNLVQAASFTERLIQFLEPLLSEQYIQIPHSLSAVLYYKENLKIDTERTLDEQDPYIQEELSLAPLESKTDRFWRRKPSRITYFVCQFFLGLLLGKLPQIQAISLLDQVVPPGQKEDLALLQNFFWVGLAEDPQKRFQTLQELKEHFRALQSHLFNSSPVSLTEKELPRFPELAKKYQKLLEKYTAPILEVPQNKIIEKLTGYEIFFWIPKYENAYKVLVQVPSEVIIGRKAGVTSQQSRDTKPTKMQLSKEWEQRGGIYYYTILVAGDSCLSRQHLKMIFSVNPADPPSCEDLGSTHGITMYLDNNRSLTNSKTIMTHQRCEFFCPADQYLQLGNTALRIRRVVEGC